jgi:hypothetical protein
MKSCHPMLLHSIAIFAVASAAMAAEPPTVAPGSPPLKCDIQPYDNAWLWKVIYPNGTINTQGIWSDHLERVNVEGRDVLKRVQGMSYVRGKTMQLVTTIDPMSCAPLSTERHTIDGAVYKRTFAVSSAVTERTLPSGAAETTTARLESPLFAFNDGEDALLLASLPLRVGYEATIASIDEMTSSDNAKPTTFRVLRKENLNDVRGRTGAFVVESDYDDSTSTMWISRKPPYYLRLLVTFRDGRYRFTFDRI